MTVLNHLDAADICLVVRNFHEVLVGHREALNLMNVYPVPDGDTGSNMTMTAKAALDAIEDLSDPNDLAAVTQAVAHGSLMGARGNSGVILSQVLRALFNVFGEAESIDGNVLADGLVSASKAAYGAVGQPVEGTILTVVRESSEAALVAANSEADLLSVAAAARSRAYEAVQRTPEMLPVLADAGVVDAGGSGFALFLDALLSATDGRLLPDPPEVSALSIPVSMENGESDSLLSGGRYEVMYFLEAPDDSIVHFKEAWAVIGDSVVVVGGEGIWNCHIHTDDIGAALEAALKVGRPYDIRVSDLHEESEEQAWVREQIVLDSDQYGVDPVVCAVVAVANGAGIAKIFRSLGVHRVVAGGQSMNPSTSDLLTAVESVPANEVVLLPNNSNIVPVAEQVDGQTSKIVRVVPTQSVTEGFASLIAYDPEGAADENISSMTSAAISVVAAEITVAVRNGASEVGEISVGDHLGLVAGKVRVVASSLLDATIQLLDELLEDSHELVTIIAGVGAKSATTTAVVAHLDEHYGAIEVEVHDGGQPLYPYYLGIE